jgi:hypothetical protein
LVGIAAGACLAGLLSACLPPPPPDPPKPAAPAPTTAPTTSTTPTSTTTTSPPTTTTSSPASTTGDENGPLGSCPVFPSDNVWNEDVSNLPVDPNSAAYLSRIASLGGNQHLHADFGGDGAYGIPYVTVPGTQPLVPVTFTAYGDESDPGPYPIPLGAPIEGGSDRHVLAVDRDHCKLYELYDATRSGDHWDAGSGAMFDLRSDALRPDGWTSADAAGLPIFPGLVRYDEVSSGQIDHALRFTVSQTQRAFIHPATHFASSSTDPTLPPMGLRLRLKASFDLSGYHGEALVVLTALKRYGMIVADNGSNWYISGAADPRWNDDDLDQLKTVPGSAFEVVDTGQSIQH